VQSQPSSPALRSAPRHGAVAATQPRSPLAGTAFAASPQQLFGAPPGDVEGPPAAIHPEAATGDGFVGAADGFGGVAAAEWDPEGGAAAQDYGAKQYGAEQYGAGQPADPDAEQQQQAWDIPQAEQEGQGAAAAAQEGAQEMYSPEQVRFLHLQFCSVLGRAAVTLKSRGPARGASAERLLTASVNAQHVATNAANLDTCFLNCLQIQEWADYYRQQGYTEEQIAEWLAPYTGQADAASAVATAGASTAGGEGAPGAAAGTAAEMTADTGVPGDQQLDAEQVLLCRDVLT